MKTLTSILFLLLLSLPLSAKAEYIPDGCYVAFSDTSRCWTSPSNGYDWTVYDNRYTTAAHYGFAIEAVMYLGQDCLNTLDEGIGSFNTLYAAFQKSQKTVKTKTTLITKLRKACGSRCSRIK